VTDRRTAARVVLAARPGVRLAALALATFAVLGLGRQLGPGDATPSCSHAATP